MDKEHFMNTNEFQPNQLDEPQRIGEALRYLEARLVRHPFGRMLLHFACLSHDGHWRWHKAGIRREFCALTRVHHRSLNKKTP
jgi:hypothetical protein